MMIYILTIFQIIILITLINNDITDNNNNFIHKQQLITQD